MTLISEFQKTALKQPENIALVSETEGSLSYRQLDEYSNYIASELLSNKVHVDVVGVLLNRSFSLVAAMLGIMKAGMAYLPLDPSYPVDRLNWMLTTSKTHKIICNNLTKDVVDEKYDLMNLKDVYEFLPQSVNSCKETDVACILYTSGSTGMPNGVLMTHESILNTLIWAIEFYSLTTQDVDLQIPSCSFTSSVQDIFGTLLSGGILVMLNESKMLNARYLKMISDKYHVTHFDMVPSLYKEYLRIIKNESTLRFVLLAGEPLPLNLVNNHFEKLESIRLVNEYGMAETCSCCFVKEIFLSDKTISIGKPIPNIEYLIIDEDQDGIGELFISGKGLALGYHNNTEYTDEKFVMIKGIRYLKTGDFVKENEKGELVYICRKDNQVKVNGKRVNMTEIDYILQHDENIIDSVTTAILYRDKQLIVSFLRTQKHDIEYYLGILREKLPIHCIPNYIKIIEEFLYLPNKKIDLKGMREMFINELDIMTMKSDERYKTIIKIISEVSKGLLNEPEIEKDLRLQGIDSISFIQLLAELEEQLDFEFGYDDIENLKTVSVKSLYDYIALLKG